MAIEVGDHGRAGPGRVRGSRWLDTGIGIPAEKRASIFAPFEQADGSTTRKYGGTGLGLTISARLVALMGGRIWVEDNPEGGSVFRFTARLVTDPEARPSPGHAAGAPLLDGLRVLIVDDNQTNRLILEEVLSQWGCRPDAVAGGPQALAALGRSADRGEPFALVLLDMMMPEMDGLELAATVRADPRHAGVKMLMLTSAGEDDAGPGRELGIVAWLPKPIRQSELLNAMLDQLGAVPVPEGDVPVAAPKPRAGAPRRRRLRVLLAEDHPINQKVATRMLQDQGHEVTVVGDGRLAVEAAGSSDFDVILMDVQMPEMDGFEALATIRDRGEAGGGRIPIVALTAHAMAGDRERCLTAGFDDYLPKPIQAGTLAAALDRLIGGVRGAAPPAEPPPDDRPAFDRRAALEGLGGDEGLLDEILGLFLEDSPRLLDEVRAAAEAGDPATLGRLAHTLAGASGHFEAPEVVASARKLESIGKSGDLAGVDDAIRVLDREFDRFRRAVAASALANGSASTALGIDPSPPPSPFGRGPG